MTIKSKKRTVSNFWTDFLALWESEQYDGLVCFNDEELSALLSRYGVSKKDIEKTVNIMENTLTS
jgi:hypothetical protein